ncbi:MAG: hypothetical protein DRJ39_00570 [Thermoprotei archaeon]|nr:MAG: hypothetical protein DRJ39_00570 [Thermoprotei archaeon]
MKLPIKKERIFRALCFKEGLNISELSRETGLAKSYVFKVLKELESEGVVWISGKIYVNYDMLIRKWGEFKRYIFERLNPLILDLLIPDGLRKVLKDYAISGPYAEMLIQGETPGKPLIVYIDEKRFLDLKERLLKIGRAGIGYVRIYPYDKAILQGSWLLKGWKIVSIPQLSADIIALGVYADIGLKLFRRWLDAGKRI